MSARQELVSVGIYRNRRHEYLSVSSDEMGMGSRGYGRSASRRRDVGGALGNKKWKCRKCQKSKKSQKSRCHTS